MNVLDTLSIHEIKSTHIQSSILIPSLILLSAKLIIFLQKEKKTMSLASGFVCCLIYGYECKMEKGETRII